MSGLAGFPQGTYSTALGVTIAVGCSLLILNILIFAGVYYQRDKGRGSSGKGKESHKVQVRVSAPRRVSAPLRSPASQRPACPPARSADADGPTDRPAGNVALLFSCLNKVRYIAARQLEFNQRHDSSKQHNALTQSQQQRSLNASPAPTARNSHPAPQKSVHFTETPTSKSASMNFTHSLMSAQADQSILGRSFKPSSF